MINKEQDDFLHRNLSFRVFKLYNSSITVPRKTRSNGRKLASSSHSLAHRLFLALLQERLDADPSSQVATPGQPLVVRVAVEARGRGHGQRRRQVVVGGLVDWYRAFSQIQIGRAGHDSLTITIVPGRRKHVPGRIRRSFVGGVGVERHRNCLINAIISIK